MDHPSIDSVAERLATLEREKRQLLWIGSGFLWGAILLIACGTDWLKRPKVIEAEGIVLRDQAGRVRARLGMRRDGTSTLALIDAQGKEQVTLTGAPDHTAALNFYDRDHVKASLSSSRHGGALLSFYDNEARSAAALYLWPDSTAGLGILNGSLGVQMAAQPDGLAGVTVSERGGKEYGRLGALPPEARPAGIERGDGKAPFRISSNQSIDAAATGPAGSPELTAPRPAKRVRPESP